MVTSTTRITAEHTSLVLPDATKSSVILAFMSNTITSKTPKQIDEYYMMVKPVGSNSTVLAIMWTRLLVNPLSSHYRFQPRVGRAQRVLI
jgi:hypothetical protein